jgi:hypothetical protein
LLAIFLLQSENISLSGQLIFMFVPHNAPGMSTSTLRYTLLGIFILLTINRAQSQQKVLSLKDAEQIALSNYASIKAKANQLNASKASYKETRTEALPDLKVSAQQDYGTVNGQNGPLFGYGGLAVASAGPALANQNYNAAFGSLYVSNINWDFFSFGKVPDHCCTYQVVIAGWVSTCAVA